MYHTYTSLSHPYSLKDYNYKVRMKEQKRIVQVNNGYPQTMNDFFFDYIAFSEISLALKLTSAADLKS